MDEELIYKIEPLPLVTYTFRFLSVIALAMLIIFFKINPLAFSILMIIPILILLTSTSMLILTDKCLYIRHSYLISNFDNKKIIWLKDILSVGIEKEFDVPGKEFLPQGYRLHKSAKMILRLSNDETFELAQIGLNHQFLELIDALNIEIKKHNHREL